MSLNIAVTGPREPFPGTDKLVLAWIDGLPPDTHLFHGNAKGVDRMARDHAKERGLQVTAVEPRYKDHPGSLAPLIRNAEMLSMADDLMGFWHGQPKGGTANTLWLFRTLFRRQPQWTIIDPDVRSWYAQQSFDSLCRSPPGHWTAALNIWRDQVKKDWVRTVADADHHSKGAK